MQVYLRNPSTGQMKKTKRGFSWTSFFFGPFVPLFRGDGKWAGIGFAVCFIGMFTLGILNLVYFFVVGFKYNEWYLDGLHEKGFVEVSGVTPQAIDAATTMPVVTPVATEPAPPTPTETPIG